MRYISYQLSVLFHVLRLIYCNRVLWRKYDSNSNNIVLFFGLDIGLWTYLARAYVIHDIALLLWVMNTKDSFRIVRFRNSGSLSNCAIYYNFNDRTNPIGYECNSCVLYTLIEVLARNNQVFPPLRELRLWENKVYMHQAFSKNNINSPRTDIIEDENEIESLPIFPFLIKEPFGNHSRGIYMINDLSDYELYIKKQRSTSVYLIQELVNMTEDARVVVINGAVVYHYWRVKNKCGEWSTTSTSNGSKLDLSPLPEHVKKILIEYNKRLGINIGAYDVTFNGDNRDGNPVILEVSTSFLMNPLPPKKYEHDSYLNFKNKSFQFAKLRIQGMIDLKANQFDSYLD